MNRSLPQKTTISDLTLHYKIQMPHKLGLQPLCLIMGLMAVGIYGQSNVTCAAGQGDLQISIVLNCK